MKIDDQISQMMPFYMNALVNPMELVNKLSGMRILDVVRKNIRELAVEFPEKSDDLEKLENSLLMADSATKALGEKIMGKLVDKLISSFLS